MRERISGGLKKFTDSDDDDDGAISGLQEEQLPPFGWTTPLDGGSGYTVRTILYTYESLVASYRTTTFFVRINHSPYKVVFVLAPIA